MASSSPAPPKRTKTDIAAVAMAMELPLIMIGAVVIGGGIGYLLDQRFHTAPLLALLLGFLGFGAGIWEIVRRLAAAEKKQSNNGSS